MAPEGQRNDPPEGQRNDPPEGQWNDPPDVRGMTHQTSEECATRGDR